MTGLRILAATLIALTLFTLAAIAQSDDTAFLVADRMFVQADGTLVAEGNVEAYQGNLFLTATRVTYDPNTDKMHIDGPIRLSDGERLEFYADDASLSSEFTEGLMRGARMVLDQQLQLAAVELNRSEGRYTQLYKTVATSCRVCGDDTPPIWQIRAKKVIHDTAERQLYFEDAQFRVLDVPILYLPRLRMPDPTLSRATGFLIPEGRLNTQLGTGIKIPYFIKLGDSRDLTLTPYISPETTTLEYRYRQAFSVGDVIASGALSQDTLEAGTSRAYLFTEGNFTLGRGYELDFDLESVSDPTYMLDYGYSGKDRLDSALQATRVRRDAMVNGEIVGFKTLRESEENATQPTLILEGLYERRLHPDWIGGELRLTAESHSHYRSSTADFVGRDVSRAQGTAHWLNHYTTQNGLLIDVHGVLDISAFGVAQDVSNDESFNISPASYANLRWPLIGYGNSGTGFIFEPVAHFAASASVNEITNDESTRVEFDEANLLSLSRFPARDRVEEGARFAYGANWSRHGANGTAMRFSFGQVIRDAADPDMTHSSGLDGLASDWLVAGQIEMPTGLSTVSRALIEPTGEFSKSETRLDWTAKWGGITATHIWLSEDAQENRPKDVSEVSLNTNFDLSPNWGADIGWQFDMVTQSTSKAKIELQYRNECLDMTFSASRRFTSSTTLDPSTDFDIRVGLRGFGAGRSGSDIIRKCGN